MAYPNFFDHCTTPDEIRARYRDLAKKYHPDLGGDTATMQELNRQYENALKRMSGETFSSADGKHDYTYTYDHAKESAILVTLFALLSMKMSRVKIELIGTWIWVSGNTKVYKDNLKELGLQWSGPRQMWYYTTQNGKRHVHYRRSSMDTLRYKYGNRVLQDDAI